MKTDKRVKAVIFDLYHTLLAVEPGPSNAAARWEQLWQDFLGTLPPLSLADFDLACQEEVAKIHAKKKGSGLSWPEVDWRTVAASVAEELSGLSQAKRDAFLYGHAVLQRTTRRMHGAAEFLTKMREGGILTGIASNAQNYTLSELAAAGIRLDGFDPDLVFWSFQHGFSKPEPAVFSWLTQRLALRDIRPEETLMIGDRWENDIAPAEAAGWQTWHFKGSWPQL